MVKYEFIAKPQLWLIWSDLDVRAHFSLDLLLPIIVLHHQHHLMNSFSTLN